MTISGDMGAAMGLQAVGDVMNTLYVAVIGQVQPHLKIHMFMVSVRF